MKRFSAVFGDETFQTNSKKDFTHAYRMLPNGAVGFASSYELAVKGAKSMRAAIQQPNKEFAVVQAIEVTK